MVAFASERIDDTGPAQSGNPTMGHHVVAGWRAFVSAWAGFLRACEILVLVLEGIGAFVIGTVQIVAKFAMGLIGLGIAVWLTITAPIYFDGWIGVVAASAPLIVALFCLYRVYSALFVEHVPPRWIRQRIYGVVGSGVRRTLAFLKPAAVWLTAQTVRQAVLLTYRGRRALARLETARRA